MLIFFSCTPETRNLKINVSGRFSSIIIEKKQLLWLPVCFLGNKTFRKRSLLLTLLHSEWPKLDRVLAILSAVGLKEIICSKGS